MKYLVTGVAGFIGFHLTKMLLEKGETVVGSEHFNLQTIGLRLFSVYGTFGRPDMAYMIFAKAIANYLPVNIYGDGTMKRDYTFIDDGVTAIVKIIDYHSEYKSNNEIYNIGSSNPVSLLELIEKLEKQLGIKAVKNFLSVRSEEIETTYADVSKLYKTTKYKPQTSIDKGIEKFVRWYKTEQRNFLNRL